MDTLAELLLLPLLLSLLLLLPAGLTVRVRLPAPGLLLPVLEAELQALEQPLLLLLPESAELLLLLALWLGEPVLLALALEQALARAEAL